MGSLTRAIAVTVAAFLLFAACTGNPQDDKQQQSPGPAAIPERVCSDLLPGREIANLLNADSLNADTDTGPALVTCTVSAGERSFGVSMSQPAADFALLTDILSDSTPGAAPIGGDIHGMAWDGYAWLITECRDKDLDVLIGAGVREVRPGRTRMARVLVELTNNWYQAGNCDAEPLPVPDDIPDPSPARPVGEVSRVCGLVKPEKITSVLGPVRDWTAQATPSRPAVVETCGLTSPGHDDRDLWFSMSRPPVARLLPVSSEDTALPGFSGKGSIDQTGADLHGRCNGKAMSYRLSAYMGPELSAGQVEKLFRAFVEAAAEREGCPVG